MTETENVLPGYFACGQLYPGHFENPDVDCYAFYAGSDTSLIVELYELGGGGADSEWHIRIADQWSGTVAELDFVGSRCVSEPIRLDSAGTYRIFVTGGEACSDGIYYLELIIG